VGLADQGREVLALERERGALGIVLVIAASRTRLDDPRELSPEPAQPLEDACPLRRQQLSCASLLSHHSWIPGAVSGRGLGEQGHGIGWPGANGGYVNLISGRSCHE